MIVAYVFHNAVHPEGASASSEAELRFIYGFSYVMTGCVLPLVVSTM